MTKVSEALERLHSDPAIYEVERVTFPASFNLFSEIAWRGPNYSAHARFRGESDDAVPYGVQVFFSESIATLEEVRAIYGDPTHVYFSIESLADEFDAEAPPPLQYTSQVVYVHDGIAWGTAIFYARDADSTITLVDFDRLSLFPPTEAGFAEAVLGIAEPGSRFIPWRVDKTVREYCVEAYQDDYECPP